MLEMHFGRHFDNVGSVLFLGAHCDDIEIGCGAAIMRLLDEYPQVHLHWVIFSSDKTRAGETRQAALRLCGADRAPVLTFRTFRNGYFPYIGADVKDAFEEIKATVQPDLIFTHYREDRHQDHRMISDLTWNTFRDHMILEYEIPKYDGDLGRPGFYIPVSEAIAERKVATLMDCFESQRMKHWFAPETIKGLMRLRGVECAAASGYAEAFHVRKIVV